MSEIRVAYITEDEFSSAIPHVPDANPRIHLPVTYQLENDEISSEVREEEVLVSDQTELSNDTVLEFDTLTPIE